MPHLEPEQLTRHALEGIEGLPDEQRVHLARCRRCAEELSELASVVRRTRAAGPPTDAPEPPPARVWARIEAGLPEGRMAPPPAAPPPPSPRRLPRTPPRPRTLPLQAVAVLAAVAVLGGGLWWTLSAPRQAILATVVLEPLEDGEPVDAHLVSTRDGLLLALDAVPESADGTYLELWLLTDDVTGLVSLGPVRPGSAAPLPEGVDLDAFPVVDVSREPLDGDPGHSGDSVLRGRLGAEASSRPPRTDPGR